MIGMPPATAASNSRSTPAASLAANSSVPTLASSSLLAVTTGLPCAQRGGDQLAGRLDAADDLDDQVDRRIGDHGWASRVSTPSASSTSRSRLRLRTATAPTSRRTPVRASIVACCAVTSLTKAEPTLPHPSTPIRTSLVTGGRLRVAGSPPKPFPMGAASRLRTCDGSAARPPNHCRRATPRSRGRRCPCRSSATSARCGSHRLGRRRFRWRGQHGFGRRRGRNRRGRGHTGLVLHTTVVDDRREHAFGTRRSIARRPAC